MLLNQIKDKIVILLKSFNSLFFFFNKFFTENDNIDVIYPKLNGDPNDLNNWLEGEITVPSLQKLIQNSLQKYPYNIIIPRLEKVSKGIMQTQIYLPLSDFSSNLSDIFYGYSNRKYSVFDNIDNIFLMKMDTSRNKVIPIFLPYRLYETFKGSDSTFENDVIIRAIFPILPSKIIETGGIHYLFLFIDDIYPSSIIHDINIPDTSAAPSSFRKIIDNPIIWFVKDTDKKFTFKNYTNTLINCDMTDETNFFVLDLFYSNIYILTRFNLSSISINKEYLLRDIELGINKTFLPIQKGNGTFDNPYSNEITTYPGNYINNTSFYYDLYSPILLINNHKNIEYTRSKINIHELHLTKVNLISNFLVNNTDQYRPPLTYQYIPTIFPFVDSGNQIYKKIGYTIEDSIEYISSIQSWNSPLDSNNSGLINFVSNISTIPYTDNTKTYNYINQISKNDSSMQIIYGILMIINSIPILYSPYLKLRGDGYFYNVIYNPNDIDTIKQRIRYENSAFIPVFYNGYKFLQNQEYTLYGKRYPYNKSFFSFAPFFGYEYEKDGVKYLIPILLREYSIYGNTLNESEFKDWNASLFTFNSYQDIPDENMMFSVFNLNNITDNLNNSDKNLAYRLLGTLVLLVNGNDWTYDETTNNQTLPLPAIRGYVEFYKNTSTPILEKIDNDI
jgi:hypothetical protein